MLTTLFSILGGAFLPLVVAPLSVLLGKIVLNLTTTLDGLSAPVKQGVVVIIAGVLTAVGATLGAKICGAGSCAGDFSNLDVKALVSATLAFAIHAGLAKATP